MTRILAGFHMIYFAKIIENDKISTYFCANCAFARSPEMSSHLVLIQVFSNTILCLGMHHEMTSKCTLLVSVGDGTPALPSRAPSSMHGRRRRRRPGGRPTRPPPPAPGRWGSTSCSPWRSPTAAASSFAGTVPTIPSQGPDPSIGFDWPLRPAESLRTPLPAISRQSSRLLLSPNENVRFLHECFLMMQS